MQCDIIRIISCSIFHHLCLSLGCSNCARFGSDNGIGLIERTSLFLYLLAATRKNHVLCSRMKIETEQKKKHSPPNQIHTKTIKISIKHCTIFYVQVVFVILYSTPSHHILITLWQYFRLQLKFTSLDAN